MEEKTAVYINDFKANDLFWGFGIENECYFELINKCSEKKFSDVLLKTKRERYSVDYNTNYHLKKREEEIFCYQNKYDKIPVPMLLNAYSLQNVDAYGEHATTYEIIPKPNKNFCGKTLLDELCAIDTFFQKERGPGKNFIFDGDSIEFTTREFYKVDIQHSIAELILKNAIFINKFNLAMDPIFHIKNCPFNYGFVNFYSNPQNTGLFNNGTYHFNITLPTKLNNLTEPVDQDDFLARHKNMGKAIQWISPLLIALYGSADIYSYFSRKYAAGSQRVCGSRYISIGTFDFDDMVFGKYLQEDKPILYKKLPNYCWLHKLEKKSGYLLPDKIGLDFNFLKHTNLGLEWRVMDMFPYDLLEDFLLVLFVIIDYSYDLPISNPIYSHRWHKLVYGCVMLGHCFQPKNKLVKKICQEFNLNLFSIWKNSSDKTIMKLLTLMIDEMYEHIKNKQFPIYNYFTNDTRKPKITNWNKTKQKLELSYYMI